MQPTLPSVCWVCSDQQTTEGAQAPPHRQVEALRWEPGQAGPEDISTMHVAHTANLFAPVTRPPYPQHTPMTLWGAPSDQLTMKEKLEPYFQVALHNMLASHSK